MRYLLFLLFSVSAFHAAGKITHIRYLAHYSEALDAEALPWLPTHWDLYIDGNRYRLEEAGNEIPRIWVGELVAAEFHLLLSLFGSEVALAGSCSDVKDWRPAPKAELPPLLAAGQTPGAPHFGGLEARPYAHAVTGEVAWLGADRMKGPCVMGFPYLPLAFRLPGVADEVWMVAEFMSASEEEVAFGVPEGYAETTMEGMRELLPTMETEK